MVIIDPGHGGNDPGMVSKYFKEKDITLKMSLYQHERFKQLGIPVKLTRNKDITLNPVARGSIVKNSGAKVCVSNHINSSIKTSVRGAETIHSIYSNGRLSNSIMNNIVESGAIKRRVFCKEHTTLKGKDYYYMHRYTGSVETIIVEYGFGSNDLDAEFILNNWKKLSESIVRAVCFYLGYIYTTPKEEVKKPNLLKIGATGDEVKILQLDLKKLNYPVGNVDGIFGIKTLNAVKQFQKDSGIKIDGIVGEVTMSKLKKALSKVLYPSNPLISNNLIRIGDRGIKVVELQRELSRLNYPVGGIDGIFGRNTEISIKMFQKDNGLIIDGIAGPKTLEKLYTNSHIIKPLKSSYYKKGNVHIIETTPDNIEIKILGNNLHNAGVYGMNGTFYNTKEYNLPRACWAIATNKGKAIGGNSMLNSYDRSIKRGTIIYYKDGSIEIKRVNSINEFSKPHIWAMGGYTIYPGMDLKGEKIPPGVNYKTSHSYIAYKGNKLFLFVKPNHMIKDILAFVKEMGFEGCIVVDGGGSSQLRHPHGQYKQSRKINNAIILKAV